MSQLMVIVKFLTIENKTSENNITNLKLSNADMTKKEVDTYLTSDLSLILALLFSCSQRHLNYLAYHYFDFGCT